MNHFDKPTDIVFTNGDVSSIQLQCYAIKDLISERLKVIDASGISKRELRQLQDMYERDAKRAGEILAITLKGQPF